MIQIQNIGFVKSNTPEIRVAEEKNNNGDEVIAICYNNFETRLHESRHGGQHARGEMDAAFFMVMVLWMKLMHIELNIHGVEFITISMTICRLRLFKDESMQVLTRQSEQFLILTA